jgi:hypothetical protein
MFASDMQGQLRRIVTAQSPQGPIVLVDGGPSAIFAGLSEIWRDGLGAKTTAWDRDLGPDQVLLEPPLGGVVVRWFSVDSPGGGMSDEQMGAAAALTFDRIGAASCHRLDDPDPAMHQTASLDLVCLISGSASLILDGAEKRLSPGDVVVQQGIAHAWRAHGGPALFFAVLIDRRVLGDPSSGETR